MSKRLRITTEYLLCHLISEPNRVSISIETDIPVHKYGDRHTSPKGISMINIEE